MNNDNCKDKQDNENLVVPFSRIRRITGYLVGDLDKFSDAKLKEVENRVKHK